MSRAGAGSGLEITLSFRGPDDDGSGFKRHRSDGVTPRRASDPVEREPRQSRTVIVAQAEPVPGQLDGAVLRACQAVIGGDTPADVTRLAAEYQVVVEQLRPAPLSIVVGGLDA